MPVLRRAIAGIAILAATLMMGGVPVHAQQQNPITLDVRAGFGGYIQQGTWSPITILASNTGDDVRGDLRIEAESLSGGKTIYTEPLDLPRGSRKQITLYPSDLSSFSNEIEVIFASGPRTIASQKVKVQFIGPQNLLIGLWSDSPATLASLGDVRSSAGKAATAQLTETDLPAVGEGWSALDVLVIADADTGKLTPDQRAALTYWVAQGGRLIVCGGTSYQRTLAGLGDISPVTPDSTVNAALDPLAAAVGKALGQQSSEAPIAVGKLSADSQVLLKGSDAPLIAWRKVGYGRIDFLAADPGLEPLRSWPDMKDLWTLILADGDPRPGWGYGFGTNWEPARNAIAAVPGVTLPSVIALCGFLALYVVLIGPVNYLVLLRLKRRELAWFTIPALVILFSAVAYLTGFQIRGTQVILHRLAVIQSWPGSDTAKVDALLGVWSPSRTRYDIQLEPGYLARSMPRDLGSALTTINDTTIEEGPTVTLRGVQVDIGSVQPFVIEGLTAAPKIQGTLELTPAEQGLRLKGDILNSSTISLTRVTLVALATAVKLDDLPAGGVARIDTVISTGYASPAGGSGLDPYPGGALAPGYSYGYGGPLSMQMAGGDDCYNSGQDRRRCNLVLGILSAQTSGSGVYLVGWSDHVPLKTDVLNATSQAADLALYVIELATSRPKDTVAVSTIPPGLTTWRMLSDSTSYGGMTPYNLSTSGGNPIMFRFEPLSIVPLPHINSLVLHIQGYDSSHNSTPQVDLWNYSTGSWDTIAVSWGDNIVSNAEPYVDGRGGVDIRVQPGSTNGVGGYLSLSRLDVTLIGQ